MNSFGSAGAHAVRPRSRPVWAHLTHFALWIIVPLWAVLGFVVWSSLEQARGENQRQILIAARTIGGDLDRQLTAMAAILKALATSPALLDGDLARFHAQARQVVPEQSAIVLRDAGGRQRLNTLVPYGTALPDTVPAPVQAAIDCALRTGTTCASDLYRASFDPQPYVILAVPVLHDGTTAYTLELAIQARQLARLLIGNALPPGWVASLIDRHDQVIARSAEHDRFVGSLATAPFRNTATAAEGTIRGTNLAGVVAWGAYVRLPGLGWRLALGVPEAALDAPLRRSAITLGLAGLLAVLASVGAAVLFGRRLARSIRALGEAAAAVGTAPRLAPTKVRELDEVASSLTAGAERLRLAQEAGRIGTWELDPGTGTAVVSASQVSLYGLPTEIAPHGFDRAAWQAQIHPEDRARATARVEAALATGSGYEDEFRILRADTGEERWIRARGTRSESHAGERFVGVNIDITEAKQAEQALAASAAEFRAIFENSVVGKAQADTATLHFTRVNRCLCELSGYEEAELLDGRGFLDLARPEDRAVTEAGLREAIAESRPYRAETWLVRKDGGLRWVILSAALLPRLAGRPPRTVATLQDITERRQAEERQALLAREVDHRAKNALAVVQAALRLTPKVDVLTFARAVEGRVGALARAQTLLAEDRWRGAQLQTLVRGELAGFDGTPPRVHIEGPPLMISAEAAQPLAMALHELATNATKHGALSAAGGQVAVQWSVKPESDLLAIEWLESGGPPVLGQPVRRGFGSRVLEATLHQIGGAAVLDWRREGLVCRIRAPLARVLAERAVIQVPAATAEAAR